MLEQIAELSDEQLLESADILSEYDSDDMRFFLEAVLREQEKREESRAFCPKVSPPDNSCSPANKGEGKPRPAFPEAFREFQERFDGSSLARPVMILGMGDVGVSQVEFSKYLESAGQEWEAAELPVGVPPGGPNDCYKNATLLVLSNSNYDYAEGLGYPDGLGGMAVLHGWAVDRRTGKVVDNTWSNPAKAKYFGVRYDRKKYMRHVAKTKYYGVFGGDDRAAAKVLERGGL